MTFAMGRLIDRGYVIIEPHPTDGRRKLLMLTPVAAALVPKLSSIVSRTEYRMENLLKKTAYDASLKSTRRLASGPM